MSKTTHIGRILVPVQFDEDSENIVRYAGLLAKAFGAELLLLNTTQSPVLTFTQQSRCMQALRTFGERVLHSQHKTNSDFVRFDCVVRPENLQNCVKSVVQEFAVDLVLVEANLIPEEEQQRTNKAATIMELVSCPVMVVPAGMSFKKLKHLVFATDFTDRDSAVLQRITSFAEQAHAKLTLVQVYSIAERSQLSSMKAAMLEVKKMFCNQGVQLKLLEEEDMLEGISDFAEREEADVLILATQDNYLMQRLFSNNYIKTMAYHTRIPLLTFRQHKNKPCSGCCTNCVNKQREQQVLQAVQLSEVHLN